MDGIKGWAAALCVAAISCALMQMLAPKDGLGKIFKLMLGAFFLCCMAMPLLELGSITSLHVDSLPGDVTNELLQEKVDASSAGRWRPRSGRWRKRRSKTGEPKRRKSP